MNDKETYWHTHIKLRYYGAGSVCFLGGILLAGYITPWFLTCCLLGLGLIVYAGKEDD